MRGLLDEFQQVEESESREVERSAREILHQLRVSGSAIASINPRAIPEGRTVLIAAARPFEERLETLRQRLIGVA
ncbi:MAG: hypothetical protein NTU41_11200 [Chloroflexi bacterium]|nr:hypothetical protein [Chloroflexota bacterium]